MDRPEEAALFPTVAAYLKSRRVSPLHTRIAHSLQIFATAVATLFFFVALMRPTINLVSGQSIGERIVRQEVLSEGNANQIRDIQIRQTATDARVEIMQKEYSTLAGNVEGVQTTMKWFAGIIAAAVGLSTIFTFRKKP